MSATSASHYEAPTESTVERHRRHLFPWVKPLYREPLVLAGGEGVRVWDEEGRSYLDLFAGILTTSVGHANPRVLSAVREQMSRLGHTSTLYVTEPQIEVASRLSELSPGSLNRAAFTNSGTEAVETALMAACIFTGRSEIVALRHGYSGRSILATNITGHARWRTLSGRMPGIVHARAPYVYRSPLGPDADEEAQVDFFIDDLVEVIETTTSGRPAALLCESILGVGGYIVPPQGYLSRAAEVIRSYGGVFISDEVQSGFGRTGHEWFGIEHEGVTPDLMVMAKGIANGFPVGATLARDEIADAWSGASISTYGGNPVSMAAARATLDVMMDEDVPSRSAIRGAQMRAALEELQVRFDWIGEVRGKGLMHAIEIVEDPDSKEPGTRRARRVVEAARNEGLLVGLGGLHSQVVRFGPSMLIEEDEMEEGMGLFARACELVDRSL